jgi:hypothetical protein
MKLISLHITPHYHPMATAIIDHAPNEFKSCYVSLERYHNGSYRLNDIPPNIDDATLSKAKAFAQTIIETALTALEGVNP